MADTTSAPQPRIRLTALSHGAGCACKLGSVDLAEVLRHLPSVVDPRVLVDAATRWLKEGVLRQEYQAVAGNRRLDAVQFGRFLDGARAGKPL